MNYQETPNWHILVDRFIWYGDARALSVIPEEITDEEVKNYLFVIHGDNMSIEEIRKWRSGDTDNMSIEEIRKWRSGDLSV